MTIRIEDALSREVFCPDVPSVQEAVRDAEDYAEARGRAMRVVERHDGTEHTLHTARPPIVLPVPTAAVHVEDRTHLYFDEVPGKLSISYRSR